MNRIQLAALCLVFSGAASSAFAQAPANDGCDAARPITAFGTFNFTTVNATTDGVANTTCNIFGSNQMFDDVWFCWTPVIAGPTRIRACSQMMFDTCFAVYEGCSPCPEAGGIIGCDDQGCNVQHSVVWNAELGHSYLIRIGGFTEGSFGAGTLTIGLPGIIAGPIVNPNNNHTYYATEPQSWERAEALAVIYGGHLATIRNQDENDWIRATLGFADETFHDLWIGLNDFDHPGTFTWINGEPVTYTNWEPGQPDNFFGDEHAVEFAGTTGTWSDTESDSPDTIYGTIEIIPPPPACPCDWNHDSFLNSQDFFDFLTGFFNNNADYNNNGTTDSQDYFDFLTCFFTGC